MLYSVEIGKNIVTIREARGITQKELAARAGMSVSRLRDVEHGRANSCINILVRIAAALSVHPLSLFLLSLSQEEIQEILREIQEFELLF